ncbi:MAG TPA: HD domain-containing protein [Anaerolineae bacterium]|nr:HD domain-containing protein [Anaerolineae bacterium]
MVFDEDDLGTLLHALHFAAEKHQNQRRKGANAPPYINHLIHVATILWQSGGVRDIPTLIAAVLHDILEDTPTTSAELEKHFGAEVMGLVQEVTDDKSLPKEVRKQLQIDHAPHLSPKAKLIKLADKIDNVTDVIHNPPADWPHARLVAYVNWAEAVVAGLGRVNPGLEARYKATLKEARRVLQWGKVE